MAGTPLFTMQASLRGTTAEVAAGGHLNSTTAPHLAEMLTLALDKRPATLVLDLGGVDYFGSAAVRVIADIARALPAGCRLTIRNPALAVRRRLLRLTGPLEHVTIEDSPQELDPAPLTVAAAWEGRICLLTITGDLDVTTAGTLPGQAAQAAGRLDGRTERLVLDLAGLTFLDVAGARALAAVASTAPAGCPVIIRAVSPAAARLLELLELNLEHRHPAPADPGEQLAEQARAARAQIAALTTGLRDTALQVARTGDRLAVTFARMAAQHPDRTCRLAALGTAAREAAAQSRRLTRQL